MRRDIPDWVYGLILVVLVGGSHLLIAFLGDGAESEQLRATLNLAEAMGGADTVGYAKALEPRPFVFPADHGPHPDFRTEWWYVTANLEADDGRRFGVQFTLFRSALAPERGVEALVRGVPGAGEVVPGSARSTGLGDDAPGWSTRQIHMGHLAVTDVAGDAFWEGERFTRVANGLAGGTSEPLRIWMDDWLFGGGTEVDTDAPGAGAVFPLTVRAGHADASVDLRLRPAKPMVLQGDRGLSQKGAGPGNASFYYSFTRLEAAGEIEIQGEPFAVTGLAWLDREWSTSALDANQEGWDWFALQLDDGYDLMVYNLRQVGGGQDPMSEGVLVSPEGDVRRLAAEDFRLESTGSWTSPLDGTVYPSGWTVRVPSQGLELEVEPVRRDQELNVSVRYWEGAVDVSGERSGRPVAGRGYVELTGYDVEAQGNAAGSRFKPTG